MEEKVVESFGEVRLNLLENLFGKLEVVGHHLFDLLSPIEYGLIHQESSVELGSILDCVDRVRFCLDPL